MNKEKRIAKKVAKKNKKRREFEKKRESRRKIEAKLNQRVVRLQRYEERKRHAHNIKVMQQDAVNRRQVAQ